MQTSFIREVSARYKTKKAKPFPITNSHDVAKFIRRQIKDNTKEHFVLLSLNAAHHVIAYSIISVGSADSAQVHPREVFQTAILAGSIAIIVAHNHPSGEVLPSQSDRRITERLREAGELLGIKVLDHVIVSDTAYHSFLEHGNG